MAEFDFSKCMYDVSVPAPKGLIKVYPDLGVYEEFVAAKNDNEIKIAVLLSDIASPFIKVKDYKQKVIAIFKHLSIDLSIKANKQLFEEVISYSNERVSAMCGVYMQMQNNHDFTHWWNTNMLYYSLMNEMGKPKGKDENISQYATTKLKIEAQAEPIKERLMKIEAELFSDSKMKQAIAKAKLKLTRTYAEMHAEANNVE